KPQDVETLTIVLPVFPGGDKKDAEQTAPLIVARMTRAEVLAPVRQQAETGGQEHKVKDKVYYTDPNNPAAAYHFPTERTLAAGPTKLVREGLERAGKAEIKGPVGTALRAAAGKHQVVAGLRLSEEMAAELFKGLKLQDRWLRRTMKQLKDLRG